MSANVPSLEERERWRERWQGWITEWGQKGLIDAPCVTEWRFALRLLAAIDALEGAVEKNSTSAAPVERTQE